MSRTEQQRYDTVQGQIEQLTADALLDKDIATTIMRAQLVAVMVSGNEQTHDRYRGLMGDLTTVLQRRIDKLQWRAWMNAPVGWTEDESAGAW